MLSRPTKMHRHIRLAKILNQHTNSVRNICEYYAELGILLRHVVKKTHSPMQYEIMYSANVEHETVNALRKLYLAAMNKYIHIEDVILDAELIVMSGQYVASEHPIDLLVVREGGELTPEEEISVKKISYFKPKMKVLTPGDFILKYLAMNASIYNILREGKVVFCSDRFKWLSPPKKSFKKTTKTGREYDFNATDNMTEYDKHRKLLAEIIKIRAASAKSSKEKASESFEQG